MGVSSLLDSVRKMTIIKIVENVLVVSSLLSAVTITTMHRVNGKVGRGVVEGTMNKHRVSRKVCCGVVKGAITMTITILLNTRITLQVSFLHQHHIFLNTRITLQVSFLHQHQS